MASFIQRKKRGIFTVTRNLSTGAVRTSSSTSTGGKNGSVRITRSIGTTGNRIYKTIRVGNAVKRTYTTTPRTKKKRGAAKDGEIGSPKRSYCMTDTPNDGVVLSSLQDLFDDIKEARINRAQII
jgi:hypothetical protein